MDTNENWAKRNEGEKKDIYFTHLEFINHFCRREKNGGKATQTNFRVGVVSQYDAPSTITSC